MAVATRYPVEPLEAWTKMKEVRRERFRNTWAPPEGTLRVMRQGDALSPLLAGLGRFSSRIFGPYFGPAMRNRDLLIKFHEAAEAHGLPAGEICSSMHHQLGQLYLGLGTKSALDDSEFPVDLVLQLAPCVPIMKAAQLAGQILGVPYFIINRNYCDETARHNCQKKTFMVAQLEEALEWLIQVTGRPFDDEKLVEAAKNEWNSLVLMAKIIQACRDAIPTPVDFHQLRELSYVTGMLGYDARCIEFNKALLDELHDKISRGISAYGYETARILYETEDLFFAMDRLMAIPRRYGALFVGDRGANVRAVWTIREDSIRVPAPSLEELGWEVKTRQNALELMAETYLSTGGTTTQFCLSSKPQGVLGQVEAWKADATTTMMDIGCRGIDVGFPQIKQALREQEVPVFTFEAANSDPRYYNENSVRELMEVFLEESLGLRPLPEAMDAR